jgi:hypothetical protein
MSAYIVAVPVAMLMSVSNACRGTAARTLAMKSAPAGPEDRVGPAACCAAVRGGLGWCVEATDAAAGVRMA